jgi:hypothetical protein
MVRRGLAGGVFLLLSWGLFSRSAAAQVQDKPFLEEERRRVMDERPRGPEDVHQLILWEIGGWLHAEFVRLDDEPFEKHRTLRYYDLRLWGELTIERRYTAYLRLQSDHVDFSSGDQFEGEDDDRTHALRVDQAFVQADWGGDGEDFVVRAGRQFLTVGRGLLFNAVAYGAHASYAAGRWGVRGFLAHSLPHDDDIDRSLPNADDSRRGFAAVEVSYLPAPYQRVYLVTLVERDFNDEDPEDPFQDWGYNARYVALGARGTISGGLGYSAEGIFQFGTSVAAGTTQEEDIRAWALLATLDYRFDSPTSAYLALEYLFGSGDPDRGSVTDTAAGNQAGTDDEGFLAFGYVHTGFSLFPRVSNLHILKFGGSLRPLAGVEAFRVLEVGMYAYGYWKDEPSGAISDPRATLAEREVGRELDLFLRWRVFSDVGMTLHFGRFWPGDAYADDDPRDFAGASVTYSF